MAGSDTGAARASGLLHMNDREFRRLSEFIHLECGIKLPPSKKTMVEARLQKRLRLLGMIAYKDYYEFLFSPRGMEEELVHLIDVITTNTTEFFREPRHFDVLSREVLPQFYKKYGESRALRLWSAGCSSGEEPYTLSIVLSEFAAAHASFRFHILATDISSRVLERAKNGIYPEDRVVDMSQALKKKYLLRSKDPAKQLIRIAPELRRLVEFRRLNFMEDFSLKDPMDVVFCRNVLIYFDRDTQQKILSKICNQIRTGGTLFIGHSESLTGMDLPLKQHAPTVYHKT